MEPEIIAAAGTKLYSLHILILIVDWARNFLLLTVAEYPFENHSFRLLCVEE